MRNKLLLLQFVFGISLLLFSGVYGANGGKENGTVQNHSSASTTEPYSLNKDMAFISVRGSRPDAKKLQGFQRAILFNARGEVVSRVDIGRDSVYSLDKMIQENRARGPLYIRMYRR